MNLHDLRYFVALAEEHHFGRAAASCGVSQPTLSTQIHRLENELGVVLAVRVGRRIEITPVGNASPKLPVTCWCYPTTSGPWRGRKPTG